MSLRILILVSVLMVGAPTVAYGQLTVARDVTPGAVFNTPGNDPKSDAIVQRLRSLIKGAAAGSDIRVSMYRFYLWDVTKELIAAHNRGVNIKVILNKDSAYPDGSGHLVNVVGVDQSQRSWVAYCTEDKACIASGSGVRPINHNKFFLFSDTSGAQNVVVQSTANLNAGSGFRNWNTAVVLVGNTEIYNSYAGYFEDQRLMGKTSDYASVRPPVQSGGVEVRYFPQATGDPVAELLSRVGCDSGGRPTVIRVGAWQYFRLTVADELRRLGGLGCQIDVVASEINTAAKARLLIPVNGRPPVALRCFINGAPLNHAKYLTIDGTVDGRQNSKVTLVGSHNFTTNSLRSTDEAQLKLLDPGIHDAFAGNHGRLVAAANGAGTQCGMTGPDPEPDPTVSGIEVITVQPPNRTLGARPTRLNFQIVAAPGWSYSPWQVRLGRELATRRCTYNGWFSCAFTRASRTGTYQISVTPVLGGQAAPPVTKTFTVRRNVNLWRVKASPSRVRKGSRVTVQGGITRLTTKGKKTYGPYKGARVAIYFTPRGGKARLAGWIKANGSGRYSRRFKVRANGTWSANFPGNGSHIPKSAQGSATRIR